MGAFVLECDNQIAGLLDLLNLRFGMPDGEGDDRYGGVAEMAELQKEFEIFKVGRPLSHSVNALGLAGFQSARAKNRWLRLLDNLPNQGADIVKRIVDNLASAHPTPMYFQAKRYDGRDKNPEFTTKAPLPYVEAPHIMVLIPMAPKPKK